MDGLLGRHGEWLVNVGDVVAGKLRGRARDSTERSGYLYPAPEIVAVVLSWR